MSGTLPDVYFGPVDEPPGDWRTAPIEDPDDDLVPATTDVIGMLGFDPADLEDEAEPATALADLLGTLRATRAAGPVEEARDDQGRWTAGEVDVLGTTAHINPRTSDTARMLEAGSPRDRSKPPASVTLRALSEPGRTAIWPAEQALHDPMGKALNFDKSANRYMIKAYPGSADQMRPYQVGRFKVSVEDGEGNHPAPAAMSPELRTALGIVRRAALAQALLSFLLRGRRRR
jgi:hypothetical protein